MADNVNVTPGTGDAIAADDIAGVKHQRVKVVLGADGVSDGDISSSNPMPVTGAVTTDGLTDAELRATPVPVSGTVTANTGLSQPVTDTQLRATPVPVSGTVTANTGLTQPLTDTQLRATAVPVSNADISAIKIATEQLASSVVADGSTPAPDNIQVIGGHNGTGAHALHVTNQGQAKVTADTLPLPTGAATETTTVGIKTATDQLRFGHGGRLKTSESSLLFFDQINGNTVNSELWKATLATMAVTQTNGELVINSASALGANTYYNLMSEKCFNRVFEFQTYLDVVASYTVGDTQITEVGFGNPATNAAITDGYFIRISSAGIFGVVVQKGVETTTAIVGASPNIIYHMEVVLDGLYAKFELNDMNGNKFEVSVPCETTVNTITRLGIFQRIYNGAVAATTANTLKIYSVTLLQLDWHTHKSFETQLATASHSFVQIEPLTFVKTANWTNSTAPTAVTLSNTAAGYTTLGGYFRFTSVTGAATDYALFAYLVPAGYTAVIKGINVDTGVNTALGATAVLMSWACGLGASAVSLATTDVWPTSSAPKFIPIGMQGFVASSAVGSVAVPLVKKFETPIVVEGGQYIHIIVRIISASTTGQFTGMVGFDGYFE